MPTADDFDARHQAARERVANLRDLMRGRVGGDELDALIAAVRELHDLDREALARALQPAPKECTCTPQQPRQMPGLHAAPCPYWFEWWAGGTVAPFGQGGAPP